MNEDTNNREYPNRPFKDRPYGRIRLNEATVYDLYQVVNNWVTHAAPALIQMDPDNEYWVAGIKGREKRMRYVLNSLVMVSEEKNWNIPE